MKVELNIGLNVAGRRNSQNDCTQRARKALEIIRHAGFRYQADRVVSQYEGDDGQLHLEDTLVVEVDAPSVGSNRTVKALAYEIAIELEQECVAIFFPRTGSGDLVGPSAASWGEFRLEFFRRYADVALPRAA